MQTPTLAIDFGTSNSAAAVYGPGGVFRIPVEHGEETLPTAVFFPTDDGAMRIGASAARALIAGEDGRYMRALKSVLGLPLLHEARLIGGRRRTLAEIITQFLIALRERSEAATGLQFRTALSGRPVHFHSADPAKDAQAEADLRACYLAAGFETVSFLAEPEAAALAGHAMGNTGELGLIVDIGGGTSDFSVFASTDAMPTILANHGVRLGGTDFDHAISMAHAMPLLGLGGQLRREMGAGLLPVPRGLYVDLSTWAKIPFLYSAETRRQVANMRRLAVDADAIGRLETVLETELGHELAFAVEHGKISANDVQQSGRINMGFIEPGLACPISAQDVNSVLAEYRALLQDTAATTLSMAGVTPDQIGRIILVGGSSLMQLVTDAVADLCPDADVLRAEAFTAVVDGLAIATQR